MVIEKGAADTDLFFLISGQVAVFTYADEAKQAFLSEVLPGDTFGETAAIDGQERTAWVVAVDDSVLGVMSSADFLDLVGRGGTLAVNALHHMAHALRRAHSSVQELSLLTPRQRVCLELLKLAGAEQRQFGDAAIDEMPSHDVLAGLALTERDVVAATIGDLMRDGIIARRKRSIVINDLTRLHAASHGNEYDRMNNESGVRTLFDQIYGEMQRPD